MEVLLNLQNKNVTLNAVHVAPEGTNCCNRLKVHFDVFQETALLIPFDRIQKISY